MSGDADRKLMNLAEAPSFELMASCVHCGLCLEACPTYRELRVEMDSPRGRIYLMKGLVNGEIEPTANVVRHLDQCLDCRACETACPSGVQYSSILEKTRTALQPARHLPASSRLVRWFVFDVLLPSRLAQWIVFKLLWLQQAVGLARLGAWLGKRRLLPGRLSGAAAQAPTIPFRSFRSKHASAMDSATGAMVFPARGERRRRVAMFTGCLADQLFADVNDATVEVLTRNGCEVHVLRDEVCCGALHIHNGARDTARGLARENVRVFNAGGFDAVISNAAGCSAELRHYADLLDGDAEAKTFGGKLRDVAEFLVEIGFVAPDAKGALPGKVAYDEPCHLLHAQKVSAPPKQILASIPGLTAVALEDADTCCGSAGVYSVLQPDLSAKVSARKIDCIARSGATIVATGNPGCLMQIRAGTRAAGLQVQVAHPIELLAESYRKADRAAG